jgi:predicted permease
LRSPLARSRVVIITAQVAIAALLLVGAALLAQSFAAMLNVDRGYVPERVTTARVVLSSPGTSPAQRTAALNELLDRLRAIPNVAAAAFTTDLPPAPARGSFGFHGTYRRRAYAIDAQIRFVSPGFFEAVGMRLEGRGYARTDTLESEPVIVVNRAFARSFLGGAGLDARPPVGLDEDRPNLPPEWRVIGIVDDVRQSATETVKPEVYACVCQITRGPDKVQFIVARTIGGTPLATSTIHQLVHDINPAAVVDQVRTLDASARNDISRPRLYAALLGAFAVFALLVSVIGLYGGLSYGVTQRTQEIGVRAALGATPADIVMLVVKQGGAMTLAGLACGLGVAAVGVRYLGAFLFGVAPYDFVSFSGVAVTLIAAGMVACIVPAIRAVRIDAIEALRRS